MFNAYEKASILVEALPYIQKLKGKTVLIKLGGHAMIDPDLEKSVLQDIVLLKLVGINVVVVHGGGPAIDAWMKKGGLKPQFINGLRVTDEAALEIAEMVLSGKINKNLVGRINQLGGNAVGICGKDTNLIQAEYKRVLTKDENGNETWTSLGLVGEITKVNPSLINILSENGYIPVISPIGIGPGFESLNINADHAAGAIGGALKADKLLMLTDVEGIYLGEGPDSLASHLTVEEVQEYITQGVITGGMIPKAESCLTAANYGVKNVHIIDGRKHHAVLLEIFTDKGIGTMIINNSN